MKNKMKLALCYSNVKIKNSSCLCIHQKKSDSWTEDCGNCLKNYASSTKIPNRS